ncbi:MAG: hypothetical protein MJA27_00760 [Pseudanabaenales cyanobacterium]|nr:hypothetical protein [Pseudanabaenales cyanobacterium]
MSKEQVTIEGQIFIDQLIWNEHQAIRDQMCFSILCALFTVAIYLILALSTPRKKDREWWEAPLSPVSSVVIAVIGLPKPAVEILNSRKRIRELQALSTFLILTGDDSRNKDVVWKIVDKITT